MWELFLGTQLHNNYVLIKDENEYSNNEYYCNSKFDIGVLVCFNMPIELNRATILALAARP